ncbi:hypothetical protein ABT56_07085 [Photobacterium aquae]|uniref:YtkA-like domain-containing protein n=1 Tax=Photobacterium aquae TaxID=1195763 RepID=A0A0J1H6F1_9GAMM|nr:hypothetical protein [Photobacterium aquae]KLV07286.1 hypothetical protein ABT56_07085 [Photobacterium aquae]
MAAEKLTRGRLIQIIFLMAVLMTAFVWRTVTYENSESVAITAINCEIGPKGCTTQDSTHINVTLSPTPAQADTPLVLHVGNTDVKPSAVIEGKSMYMGQIPVVFERIESGWKGTFSVPACTHDVMKWVVKITQGEKVINANFEVNK